MKHQEAPGTTFKKHMAIAKGLLSEDDYLLQEILFNPRTPGPVSYTHLDVYKRQLYIQMGETAKARELLEKMAAMEPHLTSTFLTLANVCFIQEDYQAMEEAANKAIAIEEGNAVAHYLLGKARKGQNDDLMTIAHLTKAITLKDDFIEARLLRAEALLNLKQYKEMMEDCLLYTSSYF